VKTFCGETRFDYWDDAEIVSIVDTNDLIEQYTSQDGEHHYFDDATMEFFGTQNFHLVAPGISVEYESNAPDGVDRWKVTAWVWNDFGSTFTAYTLCRHNNLDDASICGHISYQELDPEWCGLTHEGFCSDHGENLQGGCSQCASEEHE